MATNDIDKVLTVFEGIGGWDPELAIKDVHPTKYNQHNPPAFDGAAGVREWIARLPREKSPLKTLRVIQDSPYVVIRTDGHVFGQHVFFDLFKLEDGKNVEHWGFVEDIPPKTEWKDDNGIL
jgi:predicted SnoaL-like aldol condensation-catalyzing enzyme